MAADMAPEIEDDLPGNPEPKQPEPKKKPAPPAAKQPEPEPEPEPKKHRHTSRLVAVAAEYGLTQDDLDNNPSEVIWEEIHRLQQLEAARKPAAQAQPEKKPEPEAEKDPDEEYLAELEEVDPKLAKIVRRALSQEHLKPINEKLARLDELEKAEQARQVRSMQSMVDNAFAALGEQFEPLVGKGSIEDITDPGQQGWRGAIFGRAKIDFATDTQARINAKIAAAAKALAGDRVKEPAPEHKTAYDALADRRPTPPRDTNGRFTAADFERGHIHRPNGKQTGLDQLDAVEATRRYLKEHGDPRGERASIEFDEDLPA